MPHMSNLPWTFMFLGCLLSLWTMVALLNFKTTQSDNSNTKIKINKENNMWMW